MSTPAITYGSSSVRARHRRTRRLTEPLAGAGPGRFAVMSPDCYAEMRWRRGFSSERRAGSSRLAWAYNVPRRYYFLTTSLSMGRRNGSHGHCHALSQVPDLDPKSHPHCPALAGGAGVRLHPQGSKACCWYLCRARGTRRHGAGCEAEGLPRPDRSGLMRLVDTSAWVEWLTGRRSARRWQPNCRSGAMAGADHGAIGIGEVAGPRGRRGQGGPGNRLH